MYCILAVPLVVIALHLFIFRPCCWFAIGLFTAKECLNDILSETDHN